MVAEGRNLSKDFLGQVDHVHDKARFHKDLIQKERSIPGFPHSGRCFKDIVLDPVILHETAEALQDINKSPHRLG